MSSSVLNVCSLAQKTSFLSTTPSSPCSSFEEDIAPLGMLRKYETLMTLNTSASEHREESVGLIALTAKALSRELTAGLIS